MLPSRKRWLAAACAVFACAIAQPAEAFDRAGYLSIADRLQRHLDAHFDPALGRYEPGPGATVTQVNADLLLVHAVAARHGHDGAARNDARARAVARFLVGPDAWTETDGPGNDWRTRGPAWRATPTSPLRHPVFVTEAAEALTQAYLAREQLGLAPDTVESIRRQIARVAESVQYRYPALRLNQFNWYTAMFAANATVNGASDALATGMQRHLRTFLDGVRGGRSRAGNLGPGLHFHYLPARPVTQRSNIDSAEYAGIVLGFSRHYGQARRAGMPQPRLALLRAWVRRAVSGYWTHGGYLNWDSGLGFRRWHQRKKVPLAQQSLIGIAAERDLQPSPEWGAWAKWLLDRGLEQYTDLADREGTIPGGLAYGVNVLSQTRGDAVLAAARHAANAMRALDAGLDRRRSAEPPALYAFDPDTGRLAVTTPSYNTAIVAANRGAFPYGGLDLARLFDREQEVAATIGGRSPAAFGVRVRARGRLVLATQYGTRGRSSLRLTKAPSGVGAASSQVGRAYAGPFTDLRVAGRVTAPGRAAGSAYRFTPNAIVASWTVSSRRSDRVGVTFPSWGPGARLGAVLKGGGTVAIGARRLSLARVAALQVHSARGGYRAIPLRWPAGAAVRSIATAPQASAPTPGPTLEVMLPAGRQAFSARLEVG